jgi:hypothetical protein
MGRILNHRSFEFRVFWFDWIGRILFPWALLLALQAFGKLHLLLFLPLLFFLPFLKRLLRAPSHDCSWISSRTAGYGCLGCGREKSTGLEFLPAWPTSATTAAAAAATTTAAAATTPAPGPTAATAVSTAATSTGGLGTGFVDIHCTAIQFSAVEFGDRSFRIPALGHLNESKATGLTGFPIGYDVNAFDAAVSWESRVEVFLCGLVAEVPHKDVGHKLSPLINLVFVQLL